MGPTPLAALLKKAAPRPRLPRAAVAAGSDRSRRRSRAAWRSLERSSGSFFATAAADRAMRRTSRTSRSAAARNAAYPVSDVAAVQRAAGASDAFAATATALCSASTVRRSTSCSTLAGFGASGKPADRATALSSTSRRSGGDGATAAASASRRSRTATSRDRTCDRALTSYAPPGRIGLKCRSQVRRATAWLRGAKPITARIGQIRLLGHPGQR